MRPALIHLCLWPALLLWTGAEASTHHAAPRAKAAQHRAAAHDDDATPKHPAKAKGRRHASADDEDPAPKVRHGRPAKLSRAARAREAAAERERLAEEAKAKEAARRKAAALAAAKAAAAKRPSEVIVEDGQTLADVAARYGVTLAALADRNALEANYDAPPGLRLQLPPATLRPAPVATATLTPAIPRAPTVPYGETPLPDAMATTEPPRTPAKKTARTEADAMAAVAVASTRAPAPILADGSRARFVWPLKGEVLSAFGPKGAGQRNDGLDLAARPGEQVRAAAAGEVVYAGKELAAFGNLVLLKHAGGWVTAYAHLGRIEVAMRQTVAQGQSIGEAGASDAVEAPRVHFEVRAPSPAGAKPIDPASVLPPG